MVRLYSARFNGNNTPLRKRISLISRHIGLGNPPLGFIETQSASRFISIWPILFPSCGSSAYSSIFVCPFVVCALFVIRLFSLLCPSFKSIAAASAGVIPFASPKCGLQKLGSILFRSARIWAD